MATGAKFIFSDSLIFAGSVILLNFDAVAPGIGTGICGGGKI